MNVRNISILTCSLLLNSICPSVAAKGSDSTFTLNGFGTLGLVHSFEKEADFVQEYYIQAEGAGQSSRSSFDVDSRLGLRADWRPSDRLSFTTQIVTKPYHAGWDTQLDWAYLKFQADDNLSYRIGRMRPPTYMLSDYLDVNFVHPWIRPPTELYSTTPFNRTNGVDLIWQRRVGDVALLLQPYLSQGKFTLSGGAKTEVKRVRGMHMTAAIDDLTLRLGYVAADLTSVRTEITRAIGVLERYCGLGDSAACEQSLALSVEGKPISFTSLGFAWEGEKYFASGEIAKRRTASFIADATTGYLSGGVRLGDWTPYLAYAWFSNDSPTRFSGGSFPGVPGVAPGTNAVVTGLLVENQMDQQTATLGIRYELSEQTSLKLQWDHIQTRAKDGQPATGGGMFRNRSTAFWDRDNQVDMLSLSLDFIF